MRSVRRLQNCRRRWCPRRCSSETTMSSSKLTSAVLVIIHLGKAILVDSSWGCSKEDPKAFPKVDYNKDGRVNFEELIVVFPDLTVEEFLNADADANGVLEEGEYTRFHFPARRRQKARRASAAVGGQPTAQPAASATPAEPAKASRTGQGSRTGRAAPSLAAPAWRPRHRRLRPSRRRLRPRPNRSKPWRRWWSAARPRRAKPPAPGAPPWDAATPWSRIAKKWGERPGHYRSQHAEEPRPPGGRGG